MMAIKGQKFKIALFYKSFWLISTQKAICQHKKKSFKGLKVSQGHQWPQSKKVKRLILSIITAQFMLRKPSFSLKKVVKSKRLMKAIKSHEVKKVKKSHFINHYLIYAQEAFSQPEKSSKVQKADESHQRPRSKKSEKVSFYQSLLNLCSGSLLLA